MKLDSANLDATTTNNKNNNNINNKDPKGTHFLRKKRIRHQRRIAIPEQCSP